MDLPNIKFGEVFSARAMCNVTTLNLLKGIDVCSGRPYVLQGEPKGDLGQRMLRVNEKHSLSDCLGICDKPWYASADAYASATT